MKNIILTASLLMVVFYTSLRHPRSETDREIAETILETTEVQRLTLSDDAEHPAFQAGARAALFFERRGMQGQIRGVVVIEDSEVADLLLLQSREGLSHDALDSPDFREAFCGRPAKPPLTVDAVSGATISSQAVTNAINARLRQWVTYNDQDKDVGSMK